MEIEGQVAIGVVENEEEKYLLMRRSEENSSSGKWTFPGGKIEPDETPKKAVIREIREETSLKTKIVRSGDTYFNEGELGTWKIYPFLLKPTEFREIEMNHENDKYEWVEVEELDEYDTLGEMKAQDKLKLN